MSIIPLIGSLIKRKEIFLNVFFFIIDNLKNIIFLLLDTHAQTQGAFGFVELTLKKMEASLVGGGG